MLEEWLTDAGKADREFSIMKWPAVSIRVPVRFTM
jgi:hypothetical protein